MIAPGLGPSPVVLLDDAGASPERPASRLYTRPHEVILARRVDEVAPALARADAALAAGYHLAGWIAYEAAAAFEPRAAAAIRHMPPEPLVWLGLFDAPERLTVRDVDARLDAAGGSGAIAELRFGESARAYADNFAAVREAILEGEIYQLNYTFPVALERTGDPLALYARLRRAQPVAYGAYIDTGETRILSHSPELFLRSRSGQLEARPMKGTAPRGPTLAADREAACRLRTDAKQRAENLMIVDLLRNDLARVAEPGSVAVPELFAVETYRTVLQMTSRITARRGASVPFSELLAALFPCGSVTGAPKLRAIELIAALEEAPRGIYTGAIGWAAPDGDLCLSVPIRTLVEQAEAGLRFGVGSGIVADSRAEQEYEECRLKARFLEAEPFEPGLIETLGWTPETGYRYRECHLARLAASAAWFGYPYDLAAATTRLDALADELAAPAIVRLLLAPDGQISLSTRPLAPWPDPVRIALRPMPLAPDDPRLHHKTTSRDQYEAPLAEIRAGNLADEVVFVNAEGLLTEGARSTLFVERGGRLLTPPQSCGLLAGVLRQALLEAGRAEEALLRPDDLCGAGAIYVGNAARGLARAALVTVPGRS